MRELEQPDLEQAVPRCIVECIKREGIGSSVQKEREEKMQHTLHKICPCPGP